VATSSQTRIHLLPVLARQYFQDLWLRRWLAALAAWAVALLAMLVMMFVPDRYEASSRIFVDTQTVLKPLMAGLTYQPDMEQQVRMLAKVVVSRPNIEQLLARPEVGLGSLSDADRDKYVQRLMQQIKIESAGGTNLYSIVYRDSDKARARRIVEATLDMFVQSSLSSNKRDSEEAGQFIEGQITTYEAKLVEAESKLKDFKVKNFGVSGVSNQDFFARVSTLADEVNKLQLELSAAEQTREAYRRELATESPQLPLEQAGAGTPVVVSELDARLEAQKKQLDELLRRYTDEHPDVVSARRVIAQLEGQKRREAEERAVAEKSGAARPNAATSPVYQKIRIALAETEAQVASLRSQLGAKRANLDQLRAVAGRVPQVEAELAQLNRDYEVIRRNYEALVARRESAAMGKRLDESSRLADFRIVEPPRVSPTPVFPGRIHLAAGAVILALLAGLASPLAMDLLRPTFKDAKSLRNAIARPLLGSVSIARGAAPLRSARLEHVGLAFSIGALFVVQAGWLAWLAARSAAL
jgi:polysaccharide chain length determinant protein (PEP-CTERM system associated)